MKEAALVLIIMWFQLAGFFDCIANILVWQGLILNEFYKR